MCSRDIFPVQVNEVEMLDSSKDHWIYNLHRIRAYISHLRSPCGRIYHREMPDTWRERNLDHIKFCLKEIQNENELGPMLLWDKVVRRLKKDPKRGLNNADTRLLFRLDNMFLVKHGFTFGNWIVDPGHQHIIQTSYAPMLCYELPNASTLSHEITMRRRLPEAHQMLYERYILPPHGLFCIPEGTHYLLMAVQKTIFAVDVVGKDQVVPGAKSFRSCRKYSKERSDDDVPPPTPMPATHDVESRPSKRPNFKIPKHHLEKKRKTFLELATPKPSMPPPSQPPMPPTPQPPMPEPSMPPTPQPPMPPTPQPPMPEPFMPEPSMPHFQQPEPSMPHMYQLQPPGPSMPQFQQSEPPHMYQPQHAEWSQGQPGLQGQPDEWPQTTLKSFLELFSEDTVIVDPVQPQPVQPQPVQEPQVDFDMLVFDEDPWTIPPPIQIPSPLNPIPSPPIVQPNQPIQNPSPVQPSPPIQNPRPQIRNPVTAQLVLAPTIEPLPEPAIWYQDPPQEEALDLSNKQV